MSLELEEAVRALHEASAALARALGSRGMVEPMARRWRVTARPPKGRDGRNWQLRVFAPDGTSRQESAGTPDEDAARALAGRRERILNGETMPFREVAEAYLEWRAADPGARPRTVQRYREGLASFTRTLGDRDVSRLALLAVQDELRAVMANTSVNAAMRFARKAWNWAHDRERVSDPWPPIKPLTEQPTKLRPCTPEELERILAEFAVYGRGRYFPLVLLMADIGSRISETCRLKERDLDRHRSRVRLWVTKTEARIVCASPEVLRVVPEQEDANAYVFQRARGDGKHVDRKAINNAWCRILDRIGWRDRPIVPHSLRRSWITTAIDSGVPLRAGMAQVGHKTERQFLKYARLAPQADQKEAVARVRTTRQNSETAPTDVWGLADKVEQTEEVRDDGLWATRVSHVVTPMANPLTNPTPTADPGVRATLDGIMLLGGSARRALRAVAVDGEIAAWVVRRLDALAGD